ncbi:ABC transporter ATP-binding protein [Fimbriimonas ginsengisoli]|uniref:Lipid A export ATP-binding/permease protein MsbA n=1 Tax=Fimbriimonas ginsengisoli Gsoil 348 TaxID=661478 RepID=A0A068NZ91_FIMGI|nr:ABC transporter ATP-binding protein [Fimbriimonas ginsengisoli]AIE88164.1 Lipid A export ATP-binding/permease protein MsbA [Fimbriimonas ginsengisoli Gsoil 348]
MRSFRRTLAILRPYRGRVLLAVTMTLLVTLLQIVPPRIYQVAIDDAIRPALAARGELSKPTPARPPARETALRRQVDRAPSTITWLAVILIAVIVVRNVCSYLNSYTVSWIGNRFVFDLRFALWRHLQRLSLTFHNQTQTGKIMARATADIELIQQLIQGQLVTFISDLVTLVAVLAMLFFLEWRLAGIIVLLVPFYVVSYLTFLKNIREVSNDQRRLYDEMIGKLSEKISGIAVVKAFVREDWERQDFMKTVRAKFKVDMRQVHLNRRLGLVSAIISSLGTGVVYSYGGWMVQHGEMTTGKLVALTFYIGFIFNPAVRVIDFNNSLQWAVSAMDRVFQTLDTRPEVEDKPDALPLPSLRGQVDFQDVHFGYMEDQEVIRGVDLHVDAGQVIAIVGHSGAGKTTLMNLLMRFYDPTQGHVRVDGYNLCDVRLESLRRQISMVAQENVLFSVTLMENIKYGNRDASDEEAIRASKAADLHDFVESLPDGYETMIGENGIKLSGGQKQRLALARALVTDPRILILDDVTSALDGETEARVQDALRVVMKGRTTFIIAHRLSSVVDADRILVMEEGRIVDQGTHDELTERPGIYRDLYQEQFRSALQA